MRGKFAGAVLLVLTGAAALAAGPLLDETLMETIEVVSESLASSIGLKDVAAIETDVRDLDALFKEVEAHFRNRGDAEDAIGYTKKSRELAATVLTAVNAGRFEDAANAASEISRTCKACHRKYKP
jgi:soluble cytochrome b562